MGTGLGILWRRLTGQTLNVPWRRQWPASPGFIAPAAIPTSETAPSADLGSRLRKFPCFDFELFVDPADRTASPIVREGVYEHHIMPTFLAAIEPGMRVLDIGANIGVYAIAAARKGGKVVAVDASPENCKLIALNAELNGVQVEVLPMAVSDVRGMALYPRVADSNKTIRNYGLPLDWFDKLDAAYAAPLDSIVGEERVDIVKIDIEGREYAALKNSTLISRDRPIVFMEYSPIMCATGSGVPGSELLRLFTSKGYVMTFLGIRAARIELDSDIEAADRIAQQELDAGISIIDLVMTPGEKKR